MPLTHIFIRFSLCRHVILMNSLINSDIVSKRDSFSGYQLLPHSWQKDSLCLLSFHRSFSEFGVVWISGRCWTYCYYYQREEILAYCYHTVCCIVLNLYRVSLQCILQYSSMLLLSIRKDNSLSCIWYAPILLMCVFSKDSFSY